MKVLLLLNAFQLLLVAGAIALARGSRRWAVAAEAERDAAIAAARHAREDRDAARAERDALVAKNKQLAGQVRSMSER